jgi:hypothetical protein
MREACHDFQSVVETYYRDDPDEPVQADFHSGLASLRRTIGSCVARLCSLYDINVSGEFNEIVDDNATTEA